MSLKRLLLVALTVLIVFPASGLGKAKKIPPAPENDDEYINLPFKKIINPAFVEDVKGKWVRTRVRFAMVSDKVYDLPAEYRRGWVRIWIYDVNDMSAMFLNAAIPKEKSDIVFELAPGEIIEIRAYLQPAILTIKLTGRSQETVLFRIEDLRKVSDGG